MPHCYWWRRVQQGRDTSANPAVRCTPSPVCMCLEPTRTPAMAKGAVLTAWVRSKPPQIVQAGGTGEMGRRWELGKEGKGVPSLCVVHVALSLLCNFCSARCVPHCPPQTSLCAFMGSSLIHSSLSVHTALLPCCTHCQHISHLCPPGAHL